MTALKVCLYLTIFATESVKIPFERRSPAALIPPSTTQPLGPAARAATATNLSPW